MFTDPERILFLAVIIAAVLQAAKLFFPLINGWGAVAANATLTAVALFVVFKVDLTWNVLAVYLLIGFVAAGIHGTVTKISDHPSPRENPTPSGTPAQNFQHQVK